MLSNLSIFCNRTSFLVFFSVGQANAASFRPFTDSVCFSVDPTGPASFWACMFAFSKIAELGDTLFLVLRKRPVIFLHWYHHAVVLIYCWHSGSSSISCFFVFTWFCLAFFVVFDVCRECGLHGSWTHQAAWSGRTRVLTTSACTARGVIVHDWLTRSRLPVQTTLTTCFCVLYCVTFIIVYLGRSCTEWLRAAVL